MGKSWTEEQKKVITTRGKSLLVSAAAGSGKTAVLVERILGEILDPARPVDLDRLLIVTFTRAATSQLRDRVREAVTARYGEDPSDVRLQHQMSLLYSDHIMTIDKFFMMVIREHFQEIGLDPSFRIGDEGELKLMRSDVIASVLEEAYGQKDPDFLRFSDCYAPGNTDKALEDMVLGFWESSTSHAYPEEWRHWCLDQYQKEPGEWTWLRELLDFVKSTLSDILETIGQAEDLCQAPGGPGAAFAAVHSDRTMVENLARLDSYDALGDGFLQMTFSRISKKPKKGEEPYDQELTDRVSSLRDGWKAQLYNLRDKYFLRSLQDETALMRKMAADFAVLVRLADRFEEAFREEKTKKNILDFSDTSHLALQVLVRKEKDGTIVPTKAAREYADYFDEIAIDEYQDSNEIQELLLSAVSKESRGVFNRFMVGDVKQSIYRFRMSDPGIFIRKYETYRKEDAGDQIRIDLHRNFRSRKQVLEAVNLIFRQIMRREAGGIDYGPDESLYPGAVFPPYKEPWEGREDEICMPELILATPGEGSGDGSTDPEHLPDVRHTEAEVVASRILQIAGHDPVLDKETGKYRPAEFRDIVILLRTASDWANVYSEVLSEHGIPNRSGSRTGYFSAPEVRTVLAYLNVLDNPRQDIPLAAVLRSEIGRLTDDELALLKAGRRKESLYDCVMDLLKSAEDPESRKENGAPDREGTGSSEDAKVRRELLRKLLSFRDMTKDLRSRISDTPIHQLLWRIYDVTGFENLCEASPGGRQKKANLDMLVEKAIAYEQTSYRGLFHFVRYIEKLIKYDVDFGAALAEDGSENLVRIMTIHASKGLEFPVVIVAGLGKSFNKRDAAEVMVRDPAVGAGMNYTDPDLRVQVPTLIKSAAASRVIREGVGEELRVLYVAMTRAEEKLILAGCTKDRSKLMESLFSCAGCTSMKLPVSQILGADSFLFWVLASLVRHPEEREYLSRFSNFPEDGKLSPAAGLPGEFRILTGQDVLERESHAVKAEEQDVLALLDAEPGKIYDPGLHEKLASQLASVYPYPDLPEIPAKVTVSELKRAGYEAEIERENSADANWKYTDDQEPAADFEPVVPEFMKAQKEGLRLSGAEAGTAYHKFLADFDFAGQPAEGEAAAWLETMASCDKITEDERKAVRITRLEAFLRSGLAARMRDADRRGVLRRENPFVLSFPAKELYPETAEAAGEEQVLVQGTIDAWFEDTDGDLVLVDYKADHIKNGQQDSLVRRYRTQFLLYAAALKRLTGKKVKEAWLFSIMLGEAIEVKL